MYEHAFGTLLLAETYGTTTDTLRSGHRMSDTIAAAVDLMVRSQSDRGGWRYDPNPIEADLSVTVAATCAMMCAAAPNP